VVILSGAPPSAGRPAFGGQACPPVGRDLSLPADRQESHPQQ